MTSRADRFNQFVQSCEKVNAFEKKINEAGMLHAKFGIVPEDETIRKFVGARNIEFAIVGLMREKLLRYSIQQSARQV